MVDFHKFNNRKYDVYIWIKVDLLLNYIARPIFDAVQNGNMEEIEKLIPSLEIIDAEVIGFVWRKEIEKKQMKFKKDEGVFDTSSPKDY